MDPSPGLIGHPTTPASAAGCPECGAPRGPGEGLGSAFVGAVRLRRCPSCATVYDESDGRRLVHCDACGGPRLAPPDGCPFCEHETRVGAPASQLVDAGERELRRTLDEVFAFRDAPRLLPYLQRVARGVARGIDGAPAEARVLVFEDPAYRTLALPGGTVLLSLGALSMIEDEAALAFALGHELVHAAGGDSGRLLLRAGFHAVASSARRAADDAWVAAATEVMRLGHGDARELAADDRALRALGQAGYDPHAAARLLARIAEHEAAGAATVAEHALAHPPAAERRRRLLGRIAGLRLETGAARVDREVYRRVVAGAVRAGELQPIRPFAIEPGGRLRPGWWIWTILLATLGALLLVVALAVGR